MEILMNIAFIISCFSVRSFATNLYRLHSITNYFTVAQRHMDYKRVLLNLGNFLRDLKQITGILMYRKRHLTLLLLLVSVLSDVFRRVPRFSGQWLMRGHYAGGPLAPSTLWETWCGSLARSPGAPSAFLEMAGWSFWNETQKRSETALGGMQYAGNSTQGTSYSWDFQHTNLTQCASMGGFCTISNVLHSKKEKKKNSLSFGSCKSLINRLGVKHETNFKQPAPSYNFINDA